MSKVKKTIELWDTDRIGNDVVFHYTTPELAEDDPAHKVRVTEDELIRFIIDFELADHQDLVGPLLQDAWEDVKDRYWDDVLKAQLETSYSEAMTYIQVYSSQTKLPMPQSQYASLLEHIYKVFGVRFGKEAA